MATLSVQLVICNPFRPQAHRRTTKCGQGEISSFPFHRSDGRCGSQVRARRESLGGVGWDRPHPLGYFVPPTETSGVVI